MVLSLIAPSDNSFNPDRSHLAFLPTLDNLRNFLLTTTTEVLSFFHQLREAP
jgi:hypothetical protein